MPSPKKQNPFSDQGITKYLPEIEEKGVLVCIPDIAVDPGFFPEESLKQMPGAFELEHKKNISSLMLDKGKFSEDQKKKYFEVVDFLQEKYTKDGVLLTRKKELNYVTGEPDPALNHCLKVSDRLIQFVLEGERTLGKLDIARDTKKWRDLSTVEEHLFEGSIAALLHDVVEDGLATMKELKVFLISIGLSSEEVSRVLKIVDFLTIREGELVKEYIVRIENARSKQDISARLAQIIKICDIEVNAESKHASDRQKKKYEDEYLYYLFDRFLWLNELFPEWMNEKILKNNSYLADIIEKVKKEIQDAIEQKLAKSKRILDKK